MPKSQEETPSGPTVALKADPPLLILTPSLLESWRNTSHCASGWSKKYTGKKRNDYLYSQRNSMKCTWLSHFFFHMYILNMHSSPTKMCILIAPSIFFNGLLAERLWCADRFAVIKYGHSAANTILHFPYSLPILSYNCTLLGKDMLKYIGSSRNQSMYEFF